MMWRSLQCESIVYTHELRQRNDEQLIKLIVNIRDEIAFTSLVKGAERVEGLLTTS